MLQRNKHLFFWPLLQPIFDVTTNRCFSAGTLTGTFTGGATGEVCCYQCESLGRG